MFIFLFDVAKGKHGLYLYAGKIAHFSLRYEKVNKRIVCKHPVASGLRYINKLTKNTHFSFTHKNFASIATNLGKRGTK